MAYKWKLCFGKLTALGESKTLQAAIDNLVYYSRGNKVQDFYINGHDMNKEFKLWISGDKVVHDDGREFVPMNEWYAMLGDGTPPITEGEIREQVTDILTKTFGAKP